MASVRGHPFIVRLAFAFHARGLAFLVSEFMQGGDLFTLMRCVSPLWSIPGWIANRSFFLHPRN